jgi:hypothetical protein
MISFGSDSYSGSVEPQIQIAAPALDPAPAQDRFTRYLAFLILVIGLKL